MFKIYKMFGRVSYFQSLLLPIYLFMFYFSLWNLFKRYIMLGQGVLTFNCFRGKLVWRLLSILQKGLQFSSCERIILVEFMDNLFFILKTVYLYSTWLIFIALVHDVLMKPVANFTVSSVSEVSVNKTI